MVPDRADTWTRMVYTGPNQPVAPIDNPYQMFNKLYGRAKDREDLKSVLDDVKDDLKKVEGAVGAEDKKLLEKHATFVREMEQELKADGRAADHAAPPPEPGGPGTLLDNTVIVWTNELGKGSSHTLDNIPFVLVGGGLDFKMGRSLKFTKAAHNRLLLALAHGFGHRIAKFGKPEFCGDGP